LQDEVRRRSFLRQFRFAAVVMTYSFHVECVSFVAPLGREDELGACCHHRFGATSVVRVCVKDIASIFLPEDADPEPSLERIRPGYT
jgi:hypothetical protein